jgi:hypothetical protein
MRKSLRILALVGAYCLMAAGAQAATINMPAGSTVWMEMRANACGAGGDCIGSNQPGPNPLNGIPSSSFTGGIGPQTVTGSAEINPGQIRTFLSGQNAFMFASFEDTYTVHGSTSAMFNIDVSLHMTGTMRTVAAGPFQSLLIGNVIAEIGTFNHDPSLTNETFRVQPFNAGTTATVQYNSPPGNTSPLSFAVDITASHIVVDLIVGSTFTLGYGFNSAFGVGEIDLLSTGTISFVLPDGVYLTSALGGEFGVQADAVPIPAALPLFAGGFSVIAVLARRRKRKA